MSDSFSFADTEYASVTDIVPPKAPPPAPPAGPELAPPYIRSPAAAPPFFIAEVEVFSPAVSGEPENIGYGVRPHGVLLAIGGASSSYETLRVSDLGWRSRPTDLGGVIPYPPLLQEAFALDRSVNLDTAESGVAVGWGAIRLANPQGQWDVTAFSRNSDGRNVRIMVGTKIYDPSRGIEIDPARSDLQMLFGGVATPWRLSETTLDIPLRDASYWLERPLQASLYLGTGGVQGGADLKGRPKPKTRGGTTAKPVRNITPVLVDPVNRIYQWTDAPGTVAALFEGGAQNIAYAGDVPNLYAGSTPAANYRTCNAAGLFQLGSPAFRPITVDATGAFPSGAAPTTALALAKALLLEDIALPADLLDATSFAAADAAYPYTSGWHFPAEQIEAADAVSVFLSGLGAKLVPKRAGPLSVYVLRAVPASMQPSVTLTPSEIVSLQPLALPRNLSPPPYRFRVGYDRAHTEQTTDLSPNISDTRKSFVAQEYRQAGWSSGEILLAYRRPNDPPPLTGALLDVSAAQACADAFGALWKPGTALYSVMVPTTVGINLDIGQVVRLFWPLYELMHGKLGQIVGDQFRSGDATITLQILV